MGGNACFVQAVRIISAFNLIFKNQRQSRAKVIKQPISQNQSAACFVSKVLLDHSHACSFTNCLGLFLCYRTELSSWAETSWPVKPKVFTGLPSSRIVVRSKDVG